MPGTIFLPGAGPLGTLLGIALGVAADVEALARMHAEYVALVSAQR